MKVALDIRPALSKPTGAGIYIASLAERLPRLDADSQYTLFTSSWRERWTHPVNRPNVRVADRRVPVRVLNFAWNRLGWPPIETLCGADFDIVHSAHPLIVPTRGARKLTTIHDLFFLKRPDMTSAEVRRDYAPLVRAHAARADGILCPSEFTASEVERLLNVPRSRVAVIPLGVDPLYRTPPDEGAAREFLGRQGLPSGAILYVGSEEPRKNLKALVDGYRRFAASAQDAPALILVGPSATEMTTAAGPGRILTPGYLDRSDIRALMAVSRCLALMSLEEGFGLPVAEAMAAGLPVVCTRGGSLAEIAGDAAEFVERPEDVEGIAAGFRKVVGDPVLASSLRARGLERSRLYDWDRTASLTLAFYRRVLR